MRTRYTNSAFILYYITVGKHTIRVDNLLKTLKYNVLADARTRSNASTAFERVRTRGGLKNLALLDVD